MVGLSVNGLARWAARAQSRDIDLALQLAPFVVLLDHLVERPRHVLGQLQPLILKTDTCACVCYLSVTY